MSQMINLEVNFFVASVIWGIILLVIYDMLRIFRRLVRHSLFFVSVEDIIFWIVSGMLIFRMMYIQNNGNVRGFSIMAMGIGMMVYHNLISKFFVDAAAKLISTLISPVIFFSRKTKRFITFIFNKVKKTIKRILKTLKKSFKTVKIALSKR